MSARSHRAGPREGAGYLLRTGERAAASPRVAATRRPGDRRQQEEMAFDDGFGDADQLATANKQTLRALDMRATVDCEEFAFQHGDGRLKLIERLAAAYSTGQLP